MKQAVIVLLILCFHFSMQLKAQNIRYSESEMRESPVWIELMQKENANFFEAKKAYDLYFESREKVRGSGYKQFERWAWNVMGDVNEDGTLPDPDKVYKAHNRYQLTRQSRGPGSNAGEWIELGPTTFPNNNTGQQTGTGRINSIAFHPTDPDKFWVGAPAGGLWFTNDGGSTYVSYTDQMPTLGVSSIVVDPLNPDIIYIGTGDRDAGDAPGLGVFKSTDGGLIWNLSNDGMGNRTVGMMIMDPSNNSLLLAASSGGIYKSTDSGLNWIQVSSNTKHYKDIVFHPSNPDYVYATESGSFYRSDDRGDSWTEVSTGLVDCSRMVLGVSLNEPDAVLCLLTGGSQKFQGIFKSSDKGLNFNRITSSSHPNILGYSDGDNNSQAWYDLCMLVDPLDSDHILVGSVNIHESTNGGQNFTKKTHWVNQVHADQHCVARNPLNGRILEGHDGGLHYSDDYFTSYTNISSGLNVAQAYKIGVAAYKRDLVINGYQDNGSANYEDGVWTTILGGDGMESAFDYENQNYAYSTYIQNIKRSSNGGYGSWSTIAANGINGINENGAWVTPYMLHLSDPNTMFFGYKNIWRTNNVRSNPPSWTKISNNLGGTNSSNFHSISQSLADLDLFYCSKQNDSFFRSDNINDSSPIWIDLTANLPTSGWIDQVMCHPNDANIVYLIQANKVYKSVDKGQNWTNISGTIPSGTGLNCMTFDQLSDEGIYVGTKTGVYYKDITMADWIPFDGGLPVCNVRELEIYYDGDASAIRAATYGRGLWESNLHLDTIPDPDQASNIVFSSISTNKMTLSWTSGVGGSSLVVINTSDSFSWPANGTDPPADPSYLGNEDQVVYNGNANSVTVTGLAPETLYHVRVFDYAGEGSNTIFNLASGINNPASQETRCIPPIVFNWTTTRIASFSMNTINTSSESNNGYEDYTGESTDLLLGSTYDVSFGVSDNPMKLSIWIDWNDNAIFENDERLLSDFVCAENTVTSTQVTIPQEASPGNYVMRLIGSHNSDVLNACNVIKYGEVEDYSVVFTDKISWTGAIDSDWFENRNWNVGFIPTALDEVIILDQTNSPLIGTGLIGEAKKISFELDAEIEIQGILNVDN